MEFVEGKCCGDCAKCQVEPRPRSAQGMQICAVANILPMVFCTHDLLVEQNALIAKLLKKKDNEIDELKKLVKACIKSGHEMDDLGEEAITAAEEEEKLPAPSEEEPKRAKKLK